MPIYEFVCEDCHIRFDALRRMEDRNSAPCPQCNKLVSKVMSVVNHTFGWRLTEDSHIDNPHPELGRKEDKWEKDI